MATNDELEEKKARDAEAAAFESKALNKGKKADSNDDKKESDDDMVALWKIVSETAKEVNPWKAMEEKLKNSVSEGLAAAAQKMGSLFNKNKSQEPTEVEPDAEQNADASNETANAPDETADVPDESVAATPEPAAGSSELKFAKMGSTATLANDQDAPVVAVESEANDAENESPAHSATNEADEADRPNLS